MDADREITRLLDACRAGDSAARERLFAQAYEELKRIARHHARRAQPNATLTTTVLVHEAFLRLAGGTQLDVQSREHFLALCARAMRQVVIDYARHRAAGQRANADVALALEWQDADSPASVLALDQALSQLEAHEPRLVQLVELRAFAGLSLEAIADLCGITVRTAQRDWLRARAWLDSALQP